MSLVTEGPQSLETSYADATSPTFVGRVAVAAAAVATAVLAESTGVTGHPSRAAKARQVLSNPLVVTQQQIAWAVVADKATGVGSSDQLILDRVEAIWDTITSGY